MQALRAKLREVGGEVKVYKNTLTEIAMRELACRAWTRCSQGPTLFTFSTDDPVAPAKALVDFAKDHKQLELKGGLIEKQVVAADGDQGYRDAAVPRGTRREAARHHVQPDVGLVRVINGPVDAIARTVQAGSRTRRPPPSGTA